MADYEKSPHGGLEPRQRPPYFYAAFAALTFGPILYLGLRKLSVISVVMWSALCAGFAVMTGWRFNEGSVFKSGIVGFIFALVPFLGIYFVVKWLSTIL